MGAIDAGVSIAAAYPGTPSTEILETLATFPGVQAEWSINEKVALEVALGASMLGRRAITAMKHVGLNVAADTLMSAGLDRGRRGPGDRGRRRRRLFLVAKRAGQPLLVPLRPSAGAEPCDAQEAYLMAREAFDLSERHQVPVLVRMTTRVCHVKRAVRIEAPLPPPARIPYVKDAARWIVTPNHVGKRLQVRADAGSRHAGGSRGLALECCRARVTTGAWAVVAFGPVCHAVREALPQAPLLSLGFSAPLPIELIRRFAARSTRCW